MNFDLGSSREHVFCTFHGKIIMTSMRPQAHLQDLNTWPASVSMVNFSYKKMKRWSSSRTIHTYLETYPFKLTCSSTKYSWTFYTLLHPLPSLDSITIPSVKFLPNLIGCDKYVVLPRNGNAEAGFSQVHALKFILLNQFSHTGNFIIFSEQRFIRCHLSDFGLTQLPIRDCRYVQLSFASPPMNWYLHESEFSPCILLLPLRVSFCLFHNWKQRLLPVIHYQLIKQSLHCCCHVAVTASTLCKTMRSTFNDMKSVKVEASFIDT